MINEKEGLVNRIHTAPSKNTKEIKSKTRNQIYVFDMNVWRYLRCLFFINVEGLDAMKLFFGIMFKDDPIIEKIGFNQKIMMEGDNLRIFKEKFIPFLKDYWICYFTTGTIFYKLYQDETTGIWYPVSEDINNGQVICELVNGEQKMRFRRLEKDFIVKSTTSLDAIKYDPTVKSINIHKYDFTEKDNIMDWVLYIEQILDNKRVGNVPGDIQTTFTTPIRSILPLYFDLKRSQNAELKIEELKTRFHVIWTDKLNYDTQKLHNFLMTHDRYADSFSKLRENIKMKIVHDTTQRIHQNNNRNTGIVSVDAFEASNPSSQTIDTLGTYYGIKNYDQKSIMRGMESALYQNIGITNTPITNGEMVSIIATPSHEPKFIPKESSKDTSEKYRIFIQQLQKMYGTPSISKTSTKQTNESIKIESQLFKFGFEEIQYNMQLAVSKIYNIINKNYVRTMKKYLKENGVNAPKNIYDLRIHFSSNFPISNDDLCQLVNHGIYTPEMAMEISMRQNGVRLDENTLLKNKRILGLTNRSKDSKKPKVKKRKKSENDDTESEDTEEEIESLKKKKKEKNKKDSLKNRKENQDDPKSTED